MTGVIDGEVIVADAETALQHIEKTVARRTHGLARQPFLEVYPQQADFIWHFFLLRDLSLGPPLPSQPPRFVYVGSGHPF
jgi:hypothetical protein